MKYESQVKPFTIEIDPSLDSLITEYGMQTLRDRYLLEDEEYAQQAFARAACAYADNQEHAQRLYNYASKLWFGFSTPILSNGGTNKGLPISCFLSATEDSREGLAEGLSEDLFLSTNGGGLGRYMGHIRSLGEATSRGVTVPGLIPWLKAWDSLTMAAHQGSTRRGSCAIYIDVSHPEIEDFIEIRRPTRSEDRRTMYLHNAVNLSDAFMVAVQNDAPWDLIDPASKKVKKTVRARDLFVSIYKARMETGEPYIHFNDTSNKELPTALKMRGLKIYGSNLCNEIYLPTAPDRTAVCCLSSLNLEKYLDWKDDEYIVEDVIRMLDNVLQHFIDNAHPTMWRAANSARKERSLGLGVMGFHSFLQSMNLPFESITAATWNQKMFAQIYHQAKAASAKLAEEKGEAPDMKGTGYRNAHVIAVAPTASNSIICGETSPSIEPWNANGFTKKTLNGTKIYKNKHLSKYLETQGLNTDETWHSIITNNGSVQHLDLDEDIKEVYKTAFELDMDWVVEHAIIRQKFICQGQSLNLFFDPEVTFGKFYAVHKKAWQGGLKGLYYVRSFTKARAENGGLTLERKELSDTVARSTGTIEKPLLELTTEESTCLTCEG